MFQSTPPRRGRPPGLHSARVVVIVSIHAPAKGATVAGERVGRQGAGFNPRPREGGDGRRGSTGPAPRGFNPRPREGGDMPPYAHNRRPDLFQSTPPRRGRQARRGPRSRRSCCFNPRPREGGDVRQAVRPLPHVGVSIHAPAKGATSRPHPPRPMPAVSIHAPAKGATRVPRHPAGVRGFQSTPPRRGRHQRGRIVTIERRVSIHAPAKGATRPRITTRPPAGGFNPRPREGGDRPAEARGHRGSTFQSTPPRRGRPPRPACWACWGAVSIHAPAKGATTS